MDEASPKCIAGGLEFPGSLAETKMMDEAAGHGNDDEEYEDDGERSKDFDQKGLHDSMILQVMNGRRIVRSAGSRRLCGFVDAEAARCEERPQRFGTR